MAFEKVNPSHPDKVADRIAGAIVDLAYKQEENPKIAVEVIAGHDECYIIAETSVRLERQDVYKAIHRITKAQVTTIKYREVLQDEHLAENQAHGLRCGDNGIFKGVPLSDEEKELNALVRKWYKVHPTDGKFIYDKEHDLIIACQSCARQEEAKYYAAGHKIMFNPLGYWTGGVNVDTGATNRKLGSDMGRAATGGGLHGKDLSKADVSVNIYAHLKAQRTGKEVNLCCAIGDEYVDGLPYSEIVDIARDYINEIGGFESFAEWGLVR